MTKVILRDTDERGGCRKAYPEYAESLAVGKLLRRRVADSKGILKRSDLPWPSVF